MSSEGFTIILRGQRFFLSFQSATLRCVKSLHGAFKRPLQETAEGKHKVVLYRDPSQFRIIETYLSGNDIPITR